MPHPNLENLRRAVRGNRSSSQISSPTQTSSPSLSSNSSSPPAGCVVLIVILGLCIVAGLFVRTGNINIENKPSPEQVVYVGYVNTINLNLRTGPGTNYASIRWLPEGTKVTYLNQSQVIEGSTWTKVRVDSQEGWVNQKHLSWQTVK